MDRNVRDFYKATFHINRVLPVENIRVQVKNFGEAVMFQEELTQALASGFECKVETWGTHSDVSTYVCCTPKKEPPTHKRKAKA